MSKINNPNDELELTEQQEKQINGGYESRDMEVILKCNNPNCNKTFIILIHKSMRIKCKFCPYQYDLDIYDRTAFDQNGQKAITAGWHYKD